MRDQLTVGLLLFLIVGAGAHCQDAGESSSAALSCFGAGSGPTFADGSLRLLVPDVQHQQNVVGFPCDQPGAHLQVELSARLRVLEGGEGGGIAFLATHDFGQHGPGPFLRDWVAPSLAGSFAVGIDVSDPPNEEPFGPLGNYRGMPEREISLHWDGREIVKRTASSEFRGDWRDLSIRLRFVTGGAEATVVIGEERVYDRYFIPGMEPYELRLALGACTGELTTEMDLDQLSLACTEPAPAARRPLHVEVFNHVLTGGKVDRFEREVELPPASWAYGRVILTLDIHDAGNRWDEWDRTGNISIRDAEGVEHVIVPFITSYRTECHWQVDVTHFRPWLTGKTTLVIAAGTTFYKGRGFMMSVALDFYPGTPELEAFRVVPLWSGTARHGSPENHFSDFFQPVEVPIDESATAARVTVTTSGHSQVGEFTPSRRRISFTPDAAAGADETVEFENVLWKDDCYLNPNRPQFGTWKFSRAGWAPGDIVWPWWIDLTGLITPGRTARFEYTPFPYDFRDAEELPPEGEIARAEHIVRAYLVLYRQPVGLIAPPALQVTGVRDGSPAAQAGVKDGDFLAAYDGAIVQSIEELRAAIQGAVAGGSASVVVVLFRDGERLEVEMPPGTMGVNLRGP